MKRKKLLLGLILILTSYFTMNVWCDTTAVEVKLDQSEYVGLGDRVKVQVKDQALNTHKYVADSLEIQVSTSEDRTGYKILVKETREDSGIFEVYVPFSLNTSNATNRSLKVKTGSRIYVKYGNITKEAVWKPDDAVLKLDRSAYLGRGMQPVITLDDSDLNLNAFLKEEVYVNVKSTSDAAGISVKLTERSEDSGVFEGRFNFDPVTSNDKDDLLKIAYNNTFTVTYTDMLNNAGKAAILTSSANWKPATGALKFNNNSLTGLESSATVTVTDQDLNLRSSYIDSVNIKISSNSDLAGVTLSLLETNKNSGTFTGTFKFCNTDYDKKPGVIKAGAKDTLIAEYLDAVNSDNIFNTKVTATAKFQLTEAIIETSAKNDVGEGSVLDITITDPDANNPSVRDMLIAKVGAGSSTNDLTLQMTETGTNTGKFKFSLYFTTGATNGQLLNMGSSDKVNIKYTDNTIPQGGSKDIIKTVTWKYQNQMLSMDKSAYAGYNTYATVTLFNMDLNNDSGEAERLNVEVETSNRKSIKLELKETSADSGKFQGRLYFGRSSDNGDDRIKVVGNDTITVTYTNKDDEDDIVQCYADWSPQDATITLNRTECTGKGAPVVITLKDWDATKDSGSKDEVRVEARVQGTTRNKTVALTETSGNSGVFEGTLYLNGGDGPSLKVSEGEKIVLIYEDKDTTSGNEQDIISEPVVWKGISTATISMDKTEYQGYDTYMTITLTDPDQNKYPNKRDSNEVVIKTASSSTGKRYTVRETGANTGILTVKIKLTKEASDTSNLRVTDGDTITVTFPDKNVSVKATFRK